MRHSLTTNHFFWSMLFNLAVLDKTHPFRWRGRPHRGRANKAQQPHGLTVVICQAPLACLWWSHRWIYPKVNGDSPRWLQVRHSDYRPSLWVPLIDVACVYLFTLPLNLWIQCKPSRRDVNVGGWLSERGGKDCMAWFMLCYAEQ